MHISNLVNRQQFTTVTTPTAEAPQHSQTFGPGPSENNNDTNGTSLPAYLWVLVILFISLAVSCGICARRTRLRQNLYRQTVVNSQQSRSTAADRNPYAPPWTAFSRTSGDTSGLQPPPRARRRGSQASVTSLPLYMENPGAQEVVLLQRTIPKDEDGTAPPTRQPIIGSAEANLPANSAIPPSQPISVPSAPISPSTQATVNSNPPLPDYQHSAISVPPAPSSPGSHPNTNPPLSDTHPSRQL